MGNTGADLGRRAPQAFAWLVVLALLVSGAAACGSGSSGFDQPLSAAAQAELTQVQGAVASDSCMLVPDHDFMICGAPASSGSQPLLGEPSASNGSSIRSGIPCAAGLGGCAFSISIAPTGFSNGTAFLGAVRPADYRQPWRTATTLFQPDPADPTHLTAEFVTDFAPGTTVYAAFLSYPPRTPVPDVGPFGLDVDVLTGLIAHRADVVPSVPLVTPGG